MTRMRMDGHPFEGCHLDMSFLCLSRTFMKMMMMWILHLPDSNTEMLVRNSPALTVATLAECKPKSFGKEENCKDSAAVALFENNPTWKDDVADNNR